MKAAATDVDVLRKRIAELEAANAINQATIQAQQRVYNAEINKLWDQLANALERRRPKR